MTELSPAAQAVLDAAINVAESPNAEGIAAAALRAAADQVVPAIPFDRRYITEDRWNAFDDIRAEFLAIATELAKWGQP